MKKDSGDNVSSGFGSNPAHFLKKYLSIDISQRTSGDTQCYSQDKIRHMIKIVMHFNGVNFMSNKNEVLT